MPRDGPHLYPRLTQYFLTGYKGLSSFIAAIELKTLTSHASAESNIGTIKSITSGNLAFSGVIDVRERPGC